MTLSDAQFAVTRFVAVLTDEGIWWHKFSSGGRGLFTKI